MSGGKEKKAANTMYTDAAANEKSEAARFDTRNQGDLVASRGKADDLYSSMYGGYSSLLNPADFSNGTPGSSGGGGGGGGGGFAAPSASDPRFKEVENAYRNFSETGGWDPNRVASMDQNIAGFKSIAQNGGVDEYGQNRIRGNGVYDEFQKTGGYSDADKANIRSRATSVIPAMYQQMGDEANRQSAVQGGYGPGRAAMQSRLARDTATGVSNASRDAELGIMDKVNQGRQWGTEGMTSSEVSLQDLLSRNKLQSLSGAAQTEQGLVNSINQGKQYGISGIGGLAEADRQYALNEEALAAQRGATSASLAQQNRQWEAEFGLERQKTGLSGMQSLYTSVPEEYMQNKSFDIQNRQMSGNLIGQFGSSLSANQGKNPWITAAQVAGSGAAAYMTGGASLMVDRPWDHL